MSEMAIALQIAMKAHEGQKDKNGVEYILHPKQVAEYCGSARAKIAAILHDVVEDSEMTLDELRVAGIGEDVVVAVDCLTKREEEQLDDYFNRVASNDIAIEVKFADMRHNCDTARWPANKKAEANKNALKYGARINTLLEMVGKNKVKALMGGQFLDWFLDFWFGCDWCN